MVILVIQTYDQRSIVATKKVLYPLSTIHGEPRASMHSCSRKCARTYLRTYVDNDSPKLAPQPTPQRAAPQPCLSDREPDMLRSLCLGSYVLYCPLLWGEMLYSTPLKCCITFSLYRIYRAVRLPFLTVVLFGFKAVSFRFVSFRFVSCHFMSFH